MIRFEPDDIVFRKDQVLSGHSNGMRFTAFDHKGTVVDTRIFYSVGGGFITEEGESSSAHAARSVLYPFASARELLRIGHEKDLPIHLIMLTNEMTWRPIEKIRDGVWKFWKAMQDSTTRGLSTRGVLPGGLAVERRAADMARNLGEATVGDPLGGMEWLNVWAIAVNEENAAGGRVVTAPTNGAAGIIPAVAHYYLRFLAGNQEGILRYFLGAGAIGVLYRLCSMAISAACSSCSLVP